MTGRPRPAPDTGADGTADRGGVSLREFERSLPMALLRAREAVMDRFRPMLRSFGVTEQQWRVLRALSDVSEIEVSALAERCHILPPSLSRILRDLGARGLATRRAADRDQRVGLISITEAGRRLIEEVAPHSEARYADIATAMGEDDLTRLYALLERLDARLRKDEGTT